MSNSALDKSILIIDNDFALRDALTGFFESNEFHVQACEMGKCVETLDGRIPDLIIVDVPYKHYETEARHIVERIHTTTKKRVPILITSTDKRVKDIIHAIGGSDFLEEPFDMEALLSKVYVLLQ